MLKRVCALSLLLTVFLANSAYAAEQRFALLIDSDNHSNTGCQVATANGSAAGIEKVLTTIVSTTTTTATVARVELQVCNGGSLSQPSIISNGGWPIGLGLGTSGLAVIETSVPLSYLTPTAGSLRILATSQNAAGGADATAAFLAAVGPRDVPYAVPVSPWVLGLMASALLFIGLWHLRGGPLVRMLGLILVLVIGASIALAATVILDGNPGDWSGIAPAVTDPQGDALMNADIVAVFYQGDQTNLYFRIDADLRLDDSANQAPQVSAGLNQTVTLNSNGTLLLNLSGSISDDGLPTPAALTSLWSVVTGPGLPVPLSFGDPALPSAQVGFAAPGSYVLRLTASDGALSTSRDVTITVSAAANVSPTLINPGNRTMNLGDVLKLTLTTNDSNVRDTLTYSLPLAPVGAQMNPAGGPHLQFEPPGPGNFNFTARVADQNGLSDQKSFTVTVLAGNHAPQLVQPADATLRAGTAFSRMLAATDPDGDSPLVYNLLSAPGGMSVSGATLTWTPTLAQLGIHTIKVSVQDPGGAFDAKMFTLNVTSNVAPNAKDDSYIVKAGSILSVNAANGVLINDADADGDTLTAARLTDPGAGMLTSFNGDGSFSYQAPATVPGDPLTVGKLWNANHTWSYGAHELVADLNGDGYPDVISHNLNADIRALSGLDGSQLWALDNTGATDCDWQTGYPMHHRVLADIDDSGHPAYVYTIRCARSGSAWHDNIIAYDHLGKVKWVSPPLSKPHPDNSRGAPTVPPGGLTPGGLTWQRGLSVGRLTAAGAPVLLMRAEIPHNDAYTYYYDTSNVGHYAGCRAVTGLVADENVACRATFIISGTDGSVLQTLVVRNPAATASRPGGPNALWEMPPTAMDIDGDGRVDLVSGTEVWMQNAGGGFDFAWQLVNAVNDTAVADLDGGGKAEIIHLRSSGEPDVNNSGIFIYSHDGQLKRRIPLQAYWFTPLTIADVDGDGRSDIVLGADGTMYAFRDDGRPIWAYKVPEELPANPALASIYVLPAESFRVANAAPQVYDLDGDGVAEVVFAAYSRIMILNGRTGLRKVDPFWTFNSSYNDVSALMLIDADNDGHVDIMQNAVFHFNCFNPVAAPECAGVVGPIVLSGGSSNWLPGPKTFPNVQYRSTAIDSNARVLHDTKVSRVFRVPEQQGAVRDPRLAQATSFTYAASDGAATSAPAKVIIDIVPDNQPPVFTSSPPKSLLEVSGLDGWPAPNYYDVAAYDPDAGDTITFSLKTAPYWVSIDSASGRVRFESSCAAGYPAFCNWGWTTVIVTATDSRGASTDQMFIVNLTNQSRVVPNVVGMSFDAANTALIAQDLQGVQWTESFSAQPPGTVLAQDAAAGSVVGRFDDIRLTLSKGPSPVLVPNVVGLSEITAQTKLSNAGFTVTLSRTFSQTVPRGLVITQTPSAGSEVVPAAAQIVISSGSGLELRLAQGAVAAGGIIGFTVLAFNADGSGALTPPVTMAVAVAGGALGALPTVSGANIVTDISTLGGFELIATETGGGGRSARVSFAVLLAPAAGFSPQKPIQDLLQVLALMETQRQTLDAARLANDDVTMRSTLRAMVTTWKGWEHKFLAQTPLLITPDKLPMTPAQLVAAGHGPSAEDLLDRAALESLTQAMRTVVDQYGGSSVPINAVRTALMDAAAAVKPLALTAPSLHGVVSNLDHTTYLATRALPQSLSLLMREIDRTLTATPLLAASASASRSFSGSGNITELRADPTVHTNAFSGSLTDLTATTSIHMDLVKDYYGPIIWKVVSSAATLAAQGLLREAGITGETALAGMVTGASQSFHIFEAPGTFIEQIGASELPEETQVWIVGPSAIESAIEQIRGLIKGFSALKDLSSLNSQLAASNATEAQNLLKGNLTKITGGFKDFSEQLYAATNSVVEWPGVAGKGQGFFLVGNQVERGCIFTLHPECKQIFFGSGFPAAEKCDPRSFCTPLALLVITWTPSTMAFGADAVPFIPKYELPCAKDPVFGISLPGVPPGCTAD
ncbi:MAG: hypothetical protein C0402_11885 [Thermodesulfovibrio sp.]|nr:hypothetical protein [Thermodesulfovibrio sp.]